MSPSGGARPEGLSPGPMPGPDHPAFLARAQRLGRPTARQSLAGAGDLSPPVSVLVGAVAVFVQAGQPPPVGLPIARWRTVGSGQRQSPLRLPAGVLARQQDA